jgi:formylglycine-generating enzyme required for sulfatase activity
MANLPLTPEQAQNTSLPDTVNSYPQGDSSYGVRNMVGNVWEWVAASPVQIRGGSYQSYPPTLNQSFESLVFSGQTIPADTKRPDIGFRCAR